MKDSVVKLIRKSLPQQSIHTVEDLYRKARVHLVSARYGNPARSLRVIGVTGTNGKTTTVNFMNEILKEAGYKTAMFSTAVIEIDGQRKINDLNATVATTAEMQAFFLQAKRARVDFAILEFPSHALDQHKLDTVPVELAIMTNLTQDHLDYHKTMERYAEAKGKLFAKAPKFIVLNRDDEWFDFFDAYPAASQKITYGKHIESEAHIDRVKLYKKGTEVSLTMDHQTKIDLATALPGEFNGYNMVAAAAGAYLLGLKVDDIVEGVANLEHLPGRFERIEAGQDYDIIVDYAHTPDGLEKLLQTAKEITKKRVILVFGACGDRDKGKRPIMGEIAAGLADRIILTDEENYSENAEQIRSQIYDGIEKVAGGAVKTSEVADRKDAIAKAFSIAKRGDMVLVTGLGHEQYRIIDSKRMPWNDEVVIRELLTQTNE